jgi:chromate transporter
MIVWDLFARFVLISLLAFGGGAGISLIERTAVTEAGWIDEADFGTAIALGQVTPGPAMVAATFIGYRTAGVAGALAATLGAFLVPGALSAGVAWRLGRDRGPRWFAGFRQGAVAAAIGLLGVTSRGLGLNAVRGWSGAALVATASILAISGKVHPLWILIGSAAVGAVLETWAVL